MRPEPSHPCKMPRGKLLTQFEKGQIVALNRECMSVREIARMIGRSPGALQNFLRHPKVCDARKSSRNAKKLTKKHTRLLLREAAKGEKSCRELQITLNLPVGVRRVQQVLRGCPHLKYKKQIKRPAMQQRHKDARLIWAKNMLEKGADYWRQVVFSDEKKFNLDGPDGLASYWHDLRTEEKIFSTRHQGGDSIMLWGAISYYGRSYLVSVKGNMDSVVYCSVLEDELLPFGAETLGENWTFQQDGASCHRSKYTKEWLKSKNVKGLEWPAKSPDLNIIENVWGILARRVYHGGTQFDNVEDLVEKVIDVWDNISNEYLQKLYDSIPRRLVQVVEKKGGPTSY